MLTRHSLSLTCAITLVALPSFALFSGCGGGSSSGPSTSTPTPSPTVLPTVLPTVTPTTQPTSTPTTRVSSASFAITVTNGPGSNFVPGLFTARVIEGGSLSAGTLSLSESRYPVTGNFNLFRTINLILGNTQNLTPGTVFAAQVSNPQNSAPFALVTLSQQQVLTIPPGKQWNSTTSGQVEVVSNTATSATESDLTLKVTGLVLSAASGGATGTITLNGTVTAHLSK